MAIDSTLYHRGEFPADEPLEALRTDHNILRELFRRYFAAGEEEDKLSIGRHLLLLLETHTSLEEEVFYPRVRDVDPALVDHCEDEHEQIRPVILRLKLRNEITPQTEENFRWVADVILPHIETEEQELFPKVEQAHLDLGAIGHEMQACELRMIASRLQRPTAPGLR